MSAARRVLAVLVLCVAVGLGVVSPSSAATTPPYPDTGGAATAWSCTNAVDGAGAVTGQDCQVTGWAPDPAPTTVQAPGPIDGSAWTPEQVAALLFGVGVLVLVAVASFVIRESRPPQFGARIFGRAGR